MSQGINQLLEDSTTDAPIIQLVHQILLEAVRKKASDIHFEPYDQQYRIRYRQDGLLEEVINLPIHFSLRITARLKIMSQLDVAERRLPQDGGFKMQISKEQYIDFRINTCPTVYGEKTVLRLLDAHNTTLEIAALGLTPTQAEQFQNAINRPQGLILVTGPTGSGKTMTLYTALNQLNSNAVNIATIEDPVEIKVPGINQVPVNSKIGLSFSKILRALLRQDPDIIMVGEIRDNETAELAIKAAQTGHLVLSSVHTNNAIHTFNRLLNMGLTRENLASSLSLIVNQRLLRTLCHYCEEGCNQCNQGFKGQIGVFEVLPITKSIEQLLLSGGDVVELFQLAKSQGMQTLYQAGLEKVTKGITSLEELHRVIVE